jgi:Methyltransferase domain
MKFNVPFLKRSPRDWHDRVLFEIASAIKPACYVEVGIYHAETLNKIARVADVAIGIDINPEAERYIKTKNTRFVRADLGLGADDLDAAMSDAGAQFINLAFIDGDHRSHAVMRDFAAIAERSTFETLIVLHDTWPMDRQHAEDRYCSDSYRVPAEISHAYGGEWQCVTIPTHPGLTICSQAKARPRWVRHEQNG